MDNFNNYNNQQYPNQGYQNQGYQNQGFQQYPNQNYQQYPNQGYQQVSQKSKLVAVLLWWFLGALGAHRFYVGKIGTGILYLCTCGLFGIGGIVDLVKFFKNTFTDKHGMPLRNDCPQWVLILALVLFILAIAIILISFAILGFSIFAIVGSYA